MALLDGREELVEEFRLASAELRAYVADAFRQLLRESRTLDGVRAQLLPDETSQTRAEDVVPPRLRATASAAENDPSS